MSTTCTKDYVLTVNSALTVQAYWTFSESGLAVPRVDKVTSLALTQSFPGQMDAQPGLFGNGLAYPEKGAFSQWETPAFSAPLRLSSTNGWSVFFWFKVLHWPDNPPFGTGWSQIPTVQWRKSNSIVLNAGFDPTGPNALTFQIFDDAAFTLTPANYSPTVGVWTFLHVFYDPVSTQVGYSINNGPVVLDPHVGCVFNTSADGALYLFQNWAFPDTSTIALVVDELGLKLDRKLTPTEVAFLYNSGSGRTWPL